MFLSDIIEKQDLTIYLLASDYPKFLCLFHFGYVFFFVFVFNRKYRYKEHEMHYKGDHYERNMKCVSGHSIDRCIYLPSVRVWYVNCVPALFFS